MPTEEPRAVPLGSSPCSGRRELGEREAVQVVAAVRDLAVPDPQHQQPRHGEPRPALTHPDAAATARSALTDQIDQLAAALPGDDAALRAALAISLMLGVTLGHQMLDLPPLANASPDEIARLLRPTIQTLLTAPPPTP
ncbi:hypothetical protein ABZ801_40405 [Actinomadura sp. NPDC047616]|uniref:TetR/AcrR family transcriptional regulator n=1 Tax=Actinomadura sp. NPDC047616 TaxID=3155914 RepID=UPI0033FCA464